MEKDNSIVTRFRPLVIALLYITAGWFWILITDRIVYRFFDRVLDFEYYELFKGLLFVLATGMVLYLLLNIFFTGFKNSKKELQENHRFLQTLTNNLPGMVYRCENDRDWTMTFVSEGCRDLTGYSPEDLENNQKIAYGEIVHPAHRKYVWETVQKALHDNTTFRLVYRIICADGREKWVYEQGAGIWSKPSAHPFLEGFITDITDRKVAEEKIENLNRELTLQVQQRDARLQVLNDTLRDLSKLTFDNLRTGINGLGKLSALLEKEHADGRYKEILKLMAKAVPPLQLASEVCGNFSRIAAIDLQELNLTSIDLRELVESMMEELAGRSSNFSFELSAEKLPAALGDRDLLKEGIRIILAEFTRVAPRDNKVMIEISAGYEEGLNSYSLRLKDTDLVAEHDIGRSELQQNLMNEKVDADKMNAVHIAKLIFYRLGGSLRPEFLPSGSPVFHFTLPTTGKTV